LIDRWQEAPGCTVVAHTVQQREWENSVA